MIKLSFVYLLVAFISIDVIRCIKINFNKGLNTKVFQPSKQQLSNIKIDLSERCEAQRSHQSNLAGRPGLKYNFSIQPFSPQEVRVAFAGDSVTAGCCGNSAKEALETPVEQALNDQSDGTQQGLKGYQYFLHELLRNNNQTTKYTFMNFGITAGTITKGITHQSFLHDCRGEQFNKSMPHLAVLGFGAMDQMLKNFSESKFIEDYTDFIKKVQQLPTKPMVMLMVPVASCRFQVDQGQTTKPEELAFIRQIKDCTHEQNLDLQKTIYHIANMTGIPDEHVVNAWELLRLNPHQNAQLNYVTQDSIHPNEKGMGMIAQEFFMKMSLSKQFQERQQQVLAGSEPNFNQAVQQLLQV